MELPEDELMGCAPNGTPAYSNGGSAHGKSGFESNGSLGMKWQCVEFSRRWLWDHAGLMLPDIHIAAQIFSIPYVFNAAGEQVEVRPVRNNSTEKPTPNSFIIYCSAVGSFPGHIGVIVEVTDTEVRVADQNRFCHPWDKKSYSQAFPLVHDAASLLDNFPVYPKSWMWSSWGSVMRQFKPSPLVFPFYFGFQITRFLVVYPIVALVGRACSRLTSSGSKRD